MIWLRHLNVRHKGLFTVLSVTESQLIGDNEPSANQMLNLFLKTETQSLID